jgi:hypothetical protein
MSLPRPDNAPPRKAQTMRDRDRKREADRERRARISAGTWDFPNGGAAEFAKAGAAIHASSKKARSFAKITESSRGT